MTVTTTAHLNFRGNARDALAFYQSVFGGQLMMATYSQVGVPQDSADSDKAVFAPVDPSSPDAEHLAFGMLAAENGFRLAAYDVFGASGGGLAAAGLPDASTRAHGGLTHTESSFLLLNSESLEQAAALWTALSDGATVIQPLAPADWAPALRNAHRPLRGHLDLRHRSGRIAAVRPKTAAPVPPSAFPDSSRHPGRHPRQTSCRWSGARVSSLPATRSTGRRDTA